MVVVLIFRLRLSTEDHHQHNSQNCGCDQEADPGPTDADAPSEFTTTESGLKYRILRKSDGKVPTASDKVLVDYRGWLDDGKEFDSTYKRRIPRNVVGDDLVMTIVPTAASDDILKSVLGLSLPDKSIAATDILGSLQKEYRSFELTLLMVGCLKPR